MNKTSKTIIVLGASALVSLLSSKSADACSQAIPRSGMDMAPKMDELISANSTTLYFGLNNVLNRSEKGVGEWIECERFVEPNLDELSIVDGNGNELLFTIDDEGIVTMLEELPENTEATFRIDYQCDGETETFESSFGIGEKTSEPDSLGAFSLVDVETRAFEADSCGIEGVFARAQILFEIDDAAKLWSPLLVSTVVIDGEELTKDVGDYVGLFLSKDCSEPDVAGKRIEEKVTVVAKVLGTDIEQSSDEFTVVYDCRDEVVDQVSGNSGCQSGGSSSGLFSMLLGAFVMWFRRKANSEVVHSVK